MMLWPLPQNQTYQHSFLRDFARTIIAQNKRSEKRLIEFGKRCEQNRGQKWKSTTIIELVARVADFFLESCVYEGVISRVHEAPDEQEGEAKEEEAVWLGDVEVRGPAVAVQAMVGEQLDEEEPRQGNPCVEEHVVDAEAFPDEQAVEDFVDVRDIRSAEEYPCQRHGQERDQHVSCHGDVDGCADMRAIPAVPAKEKPPDAAPQDEVPGGSVPQPADEHGQEQVPVDFPRRAAAATNREVEVLHKPGGQAHVPALPELAHIAREIGQVKVFRQTDPEHPAAADGHVRVPGKVQIELQGVGEHGKPYGGRVKGKRRLVDLIHENAEMIRDDKLLDAADHENLHTGADIRPGKRMMPLELRQ